jgi:hypothetical protein
MALLSAQLLKKQWHHVMLYTFDHDSECFPELQEGLTIVTMKTAARESIKNTKNVSDKSKLNLDTVDSPRSFWSIFHIIFLGILDK